MNVVLAMRRLNMIYVKRWQEVVTSRPRRSLCVMIIVRLRSAGKAEFYFEPRPAFFWRSFMRWLALRAVAKYRKTKTLSHWRIVLVLCYVSVVFEGKFVIATDEVAEIFRHQPPTLLYAPNSTWKDTISSNNDVGRAVATMDNQ
jgi:hypothetical protein